MTYKDCGIKMDKVKEQEPGADVTSPTSGHQALRDVKPWSSIPHQKR